MHNTSFLSSFNDNIESIWYITFPNISSWQVVCLLEEKGPQCFVSFSRWKVFLCLIEEFRRFSWSRWSLVFESDCRRYWDSSVLLRTSACNTWTFNEFRKRSQTHSASATESIWWLYYTVQWHLTVKSADIHHDINRNCQRQIP